MYLKSIRPKRTPSLIGHLASVDVKQRERKGKKKDCGEPVWPSGKALGW